MPHDGHVLLAVICCAPRLLCLLQKIIWLPKGLVGDDDTNGEGARCKGKLGRLEHSLLGSFGVWLAQMTPTDHQLTPALLLQATLTTSPALLRLVWCCWLGRMTSPTRRRVRQKAECLQCLPMLH